MKHVILALIFMVVALLVACTIQASTLTQATASDSAAVSLGAPTELTTTAAQKSGDTPAEEAEIRDTVENFGKRLQMVSLQAPDAAQQMQEQYSKFVSPTLLQQWMNDVLKAPGRIVSSPWPDRIEITDLSKTTSDRYGVTGFVIEITSTEVVSGGAAAKIPVRAIVQMEKGHWLITDYSEAR